MSLPHYFRQADIESLAHSYPLGEKFRASFESISRDELTALQKRRFLRCLARAWEIPFYQRLWGEAGIEPGDITDLSQLSQLPAFSKTDLMQSVEDYPPFGDFHGAPVNDAGAPQGLVFQTTSGTTGTPQPLYFSPRSRELQALLLARVYQLQGLVDSDVVHSVYGHGTINGGHYIREAIVHYTGALFVPAGTGLETRSVRQVSLMRRYGTTVLVGFPDYPRKLAVIAREQGYEAGRDIRVRMISGHLGQEDRAALSSSWGGATTHDWYGVGDTGVIAAQLGGDTELTVMEDAQFLEICDTESHMPVANDGVGNMIVTCLYKDDVYPIIRFNTMDLSAWADGGPPGQGFRRTRGFLGRSDNMAKVRGINVYPQALGKMLQQVEAYAGEYVLVLRRDARGSDDCLLRVECADNRADSSTADLAAAVAEGTGLNIEIEVVTPGTLAEYTGIESRQKPRRLIDQRN
jgi:phenylacetate-CoA ligase